MQALAVVPVVEEETRDLGHAEPAWVSTQRDDRIAGFDLSLAGHRQVEAEEPALEELGHELVTPHLDPELEAGKPRLGHDQLGGSHPEAVTDADVLVAETLGRQVLAELPSREGELGPLAPPQLVELGRIGVDGLVPPSVDPEVGLTVTVEVERCGSARGRRQAP